MDESVLMIDILLGRQKGLREREKEDNVTS